MMLLRWPRTTQKKAERLDAMKGPHGYQTYSVFSQQSQTRTCMEAQGSHNGPRIKHTIATTHPSNTGANMGQPPENLPSPVGRINQ